MVEVLSNWDVVALDFLGIILPGIYPYKVYNSQLRNTII